MLGSINLRSFRHVAEVVPRGVVTDHTLFGTLAVFFLMNIPQQNNECRSNRNAPPDDV